ncbi:M12 family metallopeptidase [Salinimicrobium xinjiangense]|uniref:M12 family metallopeptidase n=1 Tax=Salinimicrobium xinjiangense TaxID=438596 RepID=UPI0003F57912|nr:M12 family metallopeptidase [Salinimicrobium xinjiangense]
MIVIETLKKTYNTVTPKLTLLEKTENLLMKKFRFTYVLPALALLASCSKDNPNELEELNNIDPAVEMVAGDEMVEVARPETGSVTTVFYAGQELDVEDFNGDYLYQGDILIPKDMASTSEVQVIFEKDEVIPQNKSVGRTSGRWPENTVYYAIESGLDNKTRVYDAIKHWESNTNVKFVERTTQSNYVYFVTGSGCSSYVGMIGGKQNITLSSSCSTGNTIHEIGHAIGLWHEQSRVDRDTYITINYENVQSGREHNFHTYSQQGLDGAEYTSSLDLGSIMMYGSYSFSSNGKPTIVKKDGNTFSVQRSGLSSGDKTGINNMYPYSSGSTSTEPVYVNGQTYVIEGVTVYRHNDLWWYYSRKYGWKEVVLKNGYWYYAR